MVTCFEGKGEIRTNIEIRILSKARKTRLFKFRPYPTDNDINDIYQIDLIINPKGVQLSTAKIDEMAKDRIKWKRFIVSFSRR